MRRDPKNLLTAALLGTTVLLAAAACGSETADTAAPSASPDASKSSSTPSSPGSTTPKPTDSGPKPAVTGLVKPVVLVQGGGIAGIKDRIEVLPNGTYTVTSKDKAPRQGKLDKRQLDTITTIVSKAKIPALAAKPPVTASANQSDQFTYVITADGATLKTTEVNLPDAVKPLIAELKMLLSAPAPTP